VKYDIYTYVLNVYMLKLHTFCTGYTLLQDSYKQGSYAEPHTATSYTTVAVFLWNPATSYKC